MKDYVERVIKQVNDFYLTTEDGYINWSSVEEDFFNGISKSEMMRKYGFSLFQYKILKKYMTGQK